MLVINLNGKGLNLTIKRHQADSDVNSGTYNNDWPCKTCPLMH